MNRPKNNLWVMAAIAVFMVVVVFKVAEGSPDVEVETVVTGGDQITDNTLSTRGGISVGGSDMEIADSLATHSILFGLWQGTHTNPYAEADKAEARGNHQAAAEMRCSTRKYRKVYGKDCIEAIIYVEPDVPRETSQDKERLDALYARISEMEAERVQDKANTEKAVKQAGVQAQKANAERERQYDQIQQAEDIRQRKIEMIREEFAKDE